MSLVRASPQPLSGGGARSCGTLTNLLFFIAGEQIIGVFIFGFFRFPVFQLTHSVIIPEICHSANQLVNFDEKLKIFK